MRGSHSMAGAAASRSILNNTAHRQAGHRRARSDGSRHRGATGARAKGRTALVVAAATIALVLLAGCGPVHLVANTNIPAPLVTKIPVAIALFIPKDFAEYVHKEERASTGWRVELGRAQTDGITRLMNAMFERVVPVDSVAAGSALGSDVRAILEPSIEEYAFVTPRDAGSPFFAVSIKYRVNVYMPDGKLAESWGFTGYGTSPSQGLSHASPLAAATALAMRDAGAKLAVEFREQAVVRGLIPDTPMPDSLTDPSRQGTPGAAPGAAAAGGQGPAAPSTQPSSEQNAAEPSQPTGSQSVPQTSTPAETPPATSVSVPEEQSPAAAGETSSAASDPSAAPPGQSPQEQEEQAPVDSAPESSGQEPPPDQGSGAQIDRLLAPRQ